MALRRGAGITSNLSASPLVLQVSLCCLHSEEEVAAPTTFDIKDFIVGYILLALVLLGGAKGCKTWDLNRVEKFFQAINNL